MGKLFIYNTDTMVITAIIVGDDNKAIEDKAADLGFMGVDEFGVTYTAETLINEGAHEEHEV